MWNVSPYYVNGPLTDHYHIFLGNCENWIKNLLFLDIQSTNAKLNEDIIKCIGNTWYLSVDF